MPVLRRPVDNVTQLASFGALGLAIALLRRDLAGLVAGIVLVVLAVRTARTGVYIDDDAVVVRNTFRTFRIPRADIERVDIARAGRPSLPVVTITRADGRSVPLWCIQPSTRGRRGMDRQVTLLKGVQEALR
jgi:hypothetical protein